MENTFEQRPDGLSNADLRVEEAHLRLAQEAGGVGTWQWNLSSGKMRWSAQMFRLLGLAPQRGRERYPLLLQAVHPDDRVEAGAQFDLFAERPGPIRLEVRVPWSDGSNHWIVFLGKVETDPCGRPSQMLGIAIDSSVRHQNEEESRESVERLRLAMDVAQLGSWQLDRIRQVGRWSSDAAVMHGFPPTKTEVTLQEWMALMHPDDVQSTRAAFAALEAGRDYTTRYRISPRQGETRWILVSGTGRLHSNSRRPVRLTGLLQDVTERRRAEEALRESEARFRQVFEQSPLGKAIAGTDFRFRAVNPALCRMVGYTQQELQTLSFIDLVHPEDRPACMEMARGLVEGRLPKVQLEERFVRRSGEAFWVSVNVAPIRDADGKVLHCLGIIEDISERKQISESLRNSERRLLELNERLEHEAQRRALQLSASRAQLQAFFDNSPDWLTLQRVTKDGRFVYVDLNPTAEAAYGLPREEVVGKTVVEVLGAEAAQLPLAKFRECVRTGQPQHYVARRTMAGRTHAIDVMFVLVPAETEDGDRYIITTARDLTEREALEAQLRQAQKMEAIGKLTGGVAHDFNNLLTAILGSLSLIERRTAGDRRTVELVDLAKRAVQRGAQLSLQLLAFARRQPLHPQAVDANGLMQESVELIQRVVGETVTLDVSLKDGLPACRADAAQLQAALLNLAINARDAMPRGGTLSIWTAVATLGPHDLSGNEDASPGRFVALSVQDTGIGMSEDILARVFEPFFTTKEVGSGTGLGLSQVYGFARQLCGHVIIESAPDHGTTVTIYLPVSEETVAPPEIEAALSSAVKTTAPATVLVVEDEELVLTSTAELLREAGWRVFIAHRGNEAMAILETAEAIDVLFSDVVMPGGMTGVELARAARKLRPQIEVLLASGYSDVTLGTESGEFDLIGKPYDHVDLQNRLSKIAVRSHTIGIKHEDGIIRDAID